MVVRTVLLDEMITRLVEHERADAVLNLAAGLDARPWRMDLPERLQWYDVDLPGILETKRRVLADERPRCRLETRRSISPMSAPGSRCSPKSVAPTSASSS
jgi:O-methyltransferase involved in polyketide biosynthesis